LQAASKPPSGQQQRQRQRRRQGRGHTPHLCNSSYPHAEAPEQTRRLFLELQSKIGRRLLVSLQAAKAVSQQHPPFSVRWVWRSPDRKRRAMPDTAREEAQPMATCSRCGQLLRFVRGRGWVHPEGGTYAMRCPDCDWTGAPYPSPMDCPQCGSRKLRDDHCVLATDLPSLPAGLVQTGEASRDW